MLRSQLTGRPFANAFVGMDAAGVRRRRCAAVGLAVLKCAPIAICLMPSAVLHIPKASIDAHKSQLM